MARRTGLSQSGLQGLIFGAFSAGGSNNFTYSGSGGILAAGGAAFRNYRIGAGHRTARDREEQFIYAPRTWSYFALSRPLVASGRALVWFLPGTENIRQFAQRVSAQVRQLLARYPVSEHPGPITPEYPPTLPVTVFTATASSCLALQHGGGAKIGWTPVDLHAAYTAAPRLMLARGAAATGRIPATYRHLALQEDEDMIVMSHD